MGLVLIEQTFAALIRLWPMAFQLRLPSVSLGALTWPRRIKTNLWKTQEYVPTQKKCLQLCERGGRYPHLHQCVFRVNKEQFGKSVRYKSFIWFGKVMSGKSLAVFWPQFLELPICVFEENWIYRSSDMFLMAKFFGKFLARTPRAHVYKSLKLSDICVKTANLH